ncbi:hypothetical protein Pfo_007079 [Paulownia fortunei]|nr:hypothetical protein Pfo_007079 [Paulownia fortunei]
MEEHKQRALRRFVRRSKKPLQCYVNALAQVVQHLKDAYEQLDLKWEEDSEGFVVLMILDGCFILELLRATTATQTNKDHVGYASNDPVFSNHGKLYMLMLENQSASHDAHSQIFFSNTQEHEAAVGLLAHIRRVSKEPAFRSSSSPAKERREDQIIRSATELREAGIRIKKSKTRSLKDITFHTSGELKLPLIVVDDISESLYLNFMAFERFHFEAGNEMTSYIFFMDNIIDDARDVSLLHSAVANLFNSLSKDITLDPDCSLFEVHKQWRANLIHPYFTSPWASLSVIAAIYLFALTTIQTVFAVLSYNPK